MDVGSRKTGTPAPRFKRARAGQSGGLNEIMAKIPQTQSELERHMLEQFAFLMADADQYDAGDIHFAKRMVTTLRVLLHDTGSSHSLLGQLGQKTRYFYDTSTDPHEVERQPNFDYRNNRRAGCFLGIIGMSFPPLRLVPYLDSQQNRAFFGFVPFEEYWNRVVLMDADETAYTRKGIVCAVANQDGGAHVDPEVEEKYYRLTRHYNLGIVAAKGGEVIPKITNQVALACVRQIAHEVIRTFCLDYPYREQIAPSGAAVLTLHPVAKREQPTDDPPPPVPYQKAKPGRNDSCPCRSNKKYKQCHGRHFDIY